MSKQETIREASAWFAEELGWKYNATDSEGVDHYVTPKGKHLPFTITDPRCREACRERFKVETFHHDEDRGWYCDTSFEGSEFVTGNTIAEAEVACLIAIYNGREK